MILIGDIGNSETKICLVNSNNNIIKRYSFKTRFIQTPSLNKYLSKLFYDAQQLLLGCVYASFLGTCSI